MGDKPIRFSSPMVRALLEGTKTQTRRTSGVPTMELQPNGHWHIHNRHGGVMNAPDGQQGQLAADYLPIQPGDRLYVREAWRAEAAFDGFSPSDLNIGAAIQYEADKARSATWRDDIQAQDLPGRFRQGMHMPRWASRLTLIVTDVRVERLQDISEADAVAEGIRPFKGTGSYISPKHSDGKWRAGDNAYEMFRALWENINGPGSWDANPWVAAYSFEVRKGNIDTLLGATYDQTR